MAIPTDIRRFQLKHLFWSVLSLCVPLSLLSHLPAIGFPLLLAVSLFWGGIGCLFISDIIDNRPIDERGWVSAFFNVIGLFVVVFSFIGIALIVLLGAAMLFCEFYFNEQWYAP